MTILFCMSHINKSLQWEWFSEELTKKGINQVYVVIESKNNIGNIFFDDLKKMGLTAYLLPHTNKLSHVTNILRTISIIRKHKPDIVHTSLPFGNLVGQIAAKLTGKKTVTTCENASWAHDFNSKKQEWIDKMTFRESKKIIANSEISADYLRKHWNFDKSKLEVIYHGWKPSDYEVSIDRIEKLRLQLNMDKQKEFVVGVLARFEFWKGYEYIIEAARMLKDYPEIKFYLFGGEGSYTKEAKTRIEAYGLQDKIKHTEFIVDSPALYQLFDVHLHVPVDQYVETGGLTIIDGMMAARSQVLTLSGYAYQIAKHMQNSYVVPFKDAQAIADGILWMKNNPTKATELGQVARKDAIEMFGVGIKVEKHLAVYNEILL